MKLVVASPVEHTIDLEDVRVRICAAELVSCAIKTQNKLLTSMTSALYKPLERRVGVHVVVPRA